MLTTILIAIGLVLGIPLAILVLFLCLPIRAGATGYYRENDYSISGFARGCAGLCGIICDIDKKGIATARRYRTLDRVATRRKTAISNNRIRKRYRHRTTTGQTRIISDNKTLLLVAFANPARENKTIPELRRGCASHSDAIYKTVVENNSISAHGIESGIGNGRPRFHRAPIWIYRSVQARLWQAHPHLNHP